MSTDVKDRGLTGAILDALWPILGGSHTAASVWTEIDMAVSDVIARHRTAAQPEREAEERLAEALACIAYEDPAEPWRIAHDALKGTARPLTTPAPAVSTEGEQVEAIAAILLGSVNAPEQEIYRVSRAILSRIRGEGE